MTKHDLARKGNSTAKQSGIEPLDSKVKDEYFLCDKFNLEYKPGGNILFRRRLKDNIDFWKSLGATDFSLDITKKGYKLLLFSTLERTVLNSFLELLPIC